MPYDFLQSCWTYLTLQMYRKHSFMYRYAARAGKLKLSLKWLSDVISQNAETRIFFFVSLTRISWRNPVIFFVLYCVINRNFICTIFANTKNNQARSCRALKNIKNRNIKILQSLKKFTHQTRWSFEKLLFLIKIKSKFMQTKLNYLLLEY